MILTNSRQDSIRRSSFTSTNLAASGSPAEPRIAGTSGVIIPAGTVGGALLGWAEYQRRAGRQYRLLILAPLLIGIIPVVFSAQPDDR